MPPYYETSPFAAAAGAAGGWAQQQEQAKQDAAERQRLAAEVAAQQAALAHQKFEENRETQLDQIQRGIDPKTGKQVVTGIPPLSKNATPQQRFQWDMSMSTALAQMGYPDMANYYKNAADATELDLLRGSQADYTQAGVGLRRSQAQLNDAKTKNVQGQFEHDLQMLSLRGANAAAVARIHAAYRGAGGGRGNSAAVESRALDAALNAAAREQVGDYNRLQESVYRYKAELNAEDPQSYPNAPQAPQFIPIPVQAGGGQTTIMVMPNGQAVPARTSVPNVKQPTANITRPAAQAPPSAPSSSGNPIEDFIDRLQSIFHGSSPQRIVQRNVKTGAYRHSVDGGKTWQPGP